MDNLSQWKKPLMRILEGHSDLLRITSDFPRLGKLPALGEIPELKEIEKSIGLGGDQRAASAAVAVVVVVVCVAVAARPGAVSNPELLRAKLLDVYSPSEREALGRALALVQKNPGLIKSTLGIAHEQLGKDFISHLKQVQEALS